MTRTRADILNEYRERIERDGDDAADSWLYDQQDGWPGGWMAPDRITGHRTDVTWTAYGGYYEERY